DGPILSLEQALAGALEPGQAQELTELAGLAHEACEVTHRARRQGERCSALPAEGAGHGAATRSNAELREHRFEDGVDRIEEVLEASLGVDDAVAPHDRDR